MFEIRFHGRGGQGAVTAANILAIAAFNDGYDVQSFPFFGVERRGAPVEAYTRLDKKKIRIKMNVYTPDAVIVLDNSLLSEIDFLYGLKKGGDLIINRGGVEKQEQYNGYRVSYVDATSIAIKNKLGTENSPIVNTAILGAYVKVIKNVKLNSILDAIKDNVTIKTENNLNAAIEAFDNTVTGVF
ncbi:MAG: 2-oxoacid:acceptor oxidoreductase family protein [Candidatus Thermoplasmatota archaeon]|jgi:pyruvate ferredoxin oxidoreductase gamma subunit/2-oxoisovalerate ferredoxin oxidoreductase gamma subunit|nr:2-oxoacid:acceptor oxidoreductase family protein [Candidatus Thermoplasmatota archaeon]MCL5963419.1 2-oxoacid:acceptor oxidoreductase family protein [Candidatus Thermoplasmatota archaeon]